MGMPDTTNYPQYAKPEETKEEEKTEEKTEQ